MTSPVSFGDAFLMAKLALRIGRAFTTGRKSAPAEFLEVENQLYSLSAALAALQNAKESENGASLIINGPELPDHYTPSYRNNQDIISGMLSSCKETLDHLKKVVEQYSIISTSDDGDESRKKRWSREAKANWKKIAWTTEGGDLAVLKSNLTVHTNSLNLVLGVVTNTQTERLRNDVNQVSHMLNDIHEWYVNNLKNKPVPPVSGSDPREEKKSRFCFELHENTGTNYKLVCPQATLGSKFAGISVATSSESDQLLQCDCSHPTDYSRPRPHSVNTFDLSPLSFAVRVAGSERSWLLYKLSNKATNQLTTLMLKGVPPEFMYDFEESVMHKLNINQARVMLHHNMANTLVHISHVDTESPRLNLVETMSDPFVTNHPISAIKFVLGNSHYFRDDIDFIQILHYKIINADNIWDEPLPTQSLFNRSRTAEILVNYRKDRGVENEVIRTIIDMRWNTQIQLKADDDMVEVANCDCTSFNEAGTAYAAKSITSLFHFMTLEAATEFFKWSEAVRMELFVIHLQYPRGDEKVMLRVQAQHVHTQRMHISDADICILQDTNTQRFRMVVQSRRGYSILSQELVADFFQKLAAQGRPDYSSMTYEVYLDGTGRRRVRQDPNGLTHLGFADVSVDELFAIGLTTLTGGISAEGRISTLNLEVI
ncbi:hypothetical protein DM02DRAFT_670404 [Periconia macrospinosa]|uniref:NACHT-NTPase and P-loop NTPases N-terminal domain-containing protein n=1 Tax=Periconia macrospinosa TaxID=97972 RepID=A0A2V1DZ91_9PLEO|nr:hypothetical protein DM02DRAFT_670404 [Periconia macrospinosa]